MLSLYCVSLCHVFFLSSDVFFCFSNIWLKYAKPCATSVDLSISHGMPNLHKTNLFIEYSAVFFGEEFETFWQSAGNENAIMYPTIMTEWWSMNANTREKFFCLSLMDSNGSLIALNNLFFFFVPFLLYSD